ncbi:MAG: Uncharacterized protein G01um101429_414, partial [Parcubacteria group bacterium Gr01-1014_29]
MQRSGNAWITAVATPKATNTFGGSSGEENVQSPTSHTSNSAATGGLESYVQPEDLPRIKVDAGEDQRAAVGEQVQFRGNAWGLDDKALENARYAWNFGDGATYEGQNVGHAYMFPGTYFVRLVVSSGKYSASDDFQIIVQENTIVVSEVMPGEAGWIELQNMGEKSIHVGGWVFETADGRFDMPLGTTLAAHSFVVLSTVTTHVVLNAKGDHIYLFYPNGTYANGFQYVFEVPQGKSVSSNASVSVFTDPTPGSSNKLENPVVPVLTQQAVLAPVVVPKAHVTQENIKQLPRSVMLEQEKSVMESDTVEPDGDPILQSATLAGAPMFSKTNKEALWFGGSLVLGGLAAVGVVLFRRRQPR